MSKSSTTSNGGVTFTATVNALGNRKYTVTATATHDIESVSVAWGNGATSNSAGPFANPRSVTIPDYPFPPYQYGLGKLGQTMTVVTTISVVGTSGVISIPITVSN
jgi:hypothetical protein